MVEGISNLSLEPLFAPGPGTCIFLVSISPVHPGRIQMGRAMRTFLFFICRSHCTTLIAIARVILVTGLVRAAVGCSSRACGGKIRGGPLVAVGRVCIAVTVAIRIYGLRTTRVGLSWHKVKRGALQSFGSDPRIGSRTKMRTLDGARPYSSRAGRMTHSQILRASRVGLRETGVRR